ncbi:hypothetical protein C0Q70_01437 [Pomacea canaliculata]|uniref:Protein NDNF n=1 Tax=Pomacea canaliculata TaxID=400727 RepID=A0A2T7PZG5_POMCA|nr:hypothetical protein C0Q70_01437 [Pomacea canaliculata]
MFVFFFVVENDHSHLEITVTPCASPVQWRLYRKPLPAKDDSEESKETDPFLVQTVSLQRNLNAPLVLGSWLGESRVNYTDYDAEAGLYILDINSTKSDSIVSVLASLTPLASSHYPAIPPDAAVHVTAKTRNKLTFRWADASPVNAGAVLEYCVSVSKVRNFRTRCSVVAHAKGDKKPSFSSEDRWGFRWEKVHMREIRSKARPVKPMSPRKVFYQCVGSDREFTYRKARPGKTYYIDVFVVNNKTDAATAYNGAVAKTPRGKPKPRKKSTTIMDGERKTLKLQKKDAAQAVVFEAKHRLSSLALEFRVCTGRLSLEIFHNTTLIHTSTAKRWKRVQMKNVLPGDYVIKFPKLHKRKTFVSIYVTSKPSKLTLPRDTTIKVFDNLTTCSNVTVAWMGTNRKQKYCLYVKDRAEIRSLKRQKCSEMDARPTSERVLCTEYRHKDVNKAVMSATVSGLKPNTHYILDVYLSKKHSGPVVYDSAQVRTKSAC